MPSPIGHSLIGCATGILLLVPRSAFSSWGTRFWQARWGILGCAAVANAPDVDFVPGLLIGELNAFHHGPSHTLFWGGGLAVAIGVLTQEFWPGRGRMVGGLVLILVTGHLVADWLCQDFSAPFGIPVFWPADPAYRLSPRSIFLAMEKATLGDVFSPANLGPAWRELWIGTLCILAALGTRIRLGRTSSRPATVCPREP